MCPLHEAALKIEETNDVGASTQMEAPVSTHSCVRGPRAWLKPRRTWFDSKGWDEELDELDAGR